eukprot:scaffold108950_cov32-Tisochrysis_lutea.AAC.1
MQDMSSAVWATWENRKRQGEDWTHSTNVPQAPPPESCSVRGDCREHEHAHARSPQCDSAA